MKLVKCYIQRTENHRGQQEQLLLTYSKPYKAAAKSTVSRWIKDTLALAGIDTTVFTPHSTRAASTSRANLDNVPIATIMKTAGWSNARTFARHYNKQTLKSSNKFQTAVLK